MGSNLTKRIEGQWQSSGTSSAPMLLGPLMPRLGVTKAIVAQSMRGSSATAGTPEQVIGYRTFTMLPDRPGTISATSSQLTVDDEVVASVDLSALSTSVLYVQFLLSGRVTAAGCASAFGTLQVALDESPTLVASGEFDIQPYLASNTGYLPLGRPFAGAGISKLMYAVSVFGVQGTVNLRPAWRPMPEGEQYPGAWADLGSANAFTANGQHNFGTESVSPGTNLLHQAGLKVTTSGTNPMANNVRVLVYAC